MKKTKQILQIIFFIALSFLGFKAFGYLQKIPEIEKKVNIEINKINSQVDLFKPKIAETDKKITDILKQVEKLSLNLINFGKILDKTLENLDNLEKNISNFDNSLKEIEIILENLNNKLYLAGKGLEKIQPALKTIENTTNSINQKIAKLEKISRKKRELLNELIKIDISKLNIKIANYFKEKLMQDLAKQKELEESIKKAKEMSEKATKIINNKKINNYKKQAEESIKEVKKAIPLKKPVEKIEKNIPMGGFGF